MRSVSLVAVFAAHIIFDIFIWVFCSEAFDEELEVSVYEFVEWVDVLIVVRQRDV